jgi:uncharacterized membrane protein YhaH (DUF805 family)
VTPRRRPIFGWIAFSLILVAALVVGGAVVYGYLQTQDAFVQGPPWFVVTGSVAAIPLGILCFLGLVLGIVGLVRRERPGWPAVAAVVLAIPGFGALAFAAFAAFTVLTSCAGPAGACG